LTIGDLGLPMLHHQVQGEDCHQERERACNRSGQHPMVLRLKEREFDLDLNSTAPNVVYRVIMEDGTELEVTNPSEYPKRARSPKCTSLS
jgi:hypothetical protein